MDIEDQTISAVEEISEETPDLVLEEEETESLEPDEVNFLQITPLPPHKYTSKNSSLGNLQIVILFVQESVGPDGVEGYGCVTALAEFLLQLETCASLTNAQARKVIELWSKLSSYDKKPITFTARHRTRLTQGRFKSSVILFHSWSRQYEKVTSSRWPIIFNFPFNIDELYLLFLRCFLGQNSGPVQRPDCNRYMESLFVLLCQKYPANTKKNGKTIMRWTLVAQAYKK